MLERFRLFLSWDSVEYKNDNTAVLKNARFTGPVLKEIESMRDNDNIRLDLSFQYIEAVGSWSIATLSWKQIRSHRASEISLGDCTIDSSELTRANLLSSVDKLLIDTENHVEAKHRFHLVYPAIMINREDVPYAYKKSGV